MLNKTRQIYAITTALIVLLFLCIAATQAADSEPEKKSTPLEKKELRIAKDGKGIVDQNGNVIARFAKDIRIKSPAGQTVSLPGCMCCKPECIAWDQNGKCVKTYNSCTWDFDCNCK